MRNFLSCLVATAFTACATPALAQVSIQANVASACGTQSYPVGSSKPVVQTATGASCTDGSGGSQSKPLAVTPTDNGGTITVGGTSQTAIAANTSRKGCWVQNPVNATEDLYVSSTAAAVTTAGTPDDADLGPGGSWSCVQGGVVIQTAIRVNAVTSAHAFIAKESQ